MLRVSMIAATALAAGLATIATAPALAQQGGIREIEVFGTDPCPRSTDDEVVVCARKPETERYRIPEKLRKTGSRQSRESWARRAQVFETAGATGINSCSPVGPAGFTGCVQQVINSARDERREEAEGNKVPE